MSIYTYLIRQELKDVALAVSLSPTAGGQGRLAGQWRGVFRPKAICSHSYCFGCVCLRLLHVTRESCTVHCMQSLSCLCVCLSATYSSYLPTHPTHTPSTRGPPPSYSLIPSLPPSSPAATSPRAPDRLSCFPCSISQYACCPA
jgi:hypothetical protein